MATTIQGYYDGEVIKPLEQINALPNQRVIITITDEFVESKPQSHKTGMRGILAKYAAPELRDREKEAWERAAIDKYDAT